ncbi:sigma-54 dependent transcriptional regulator (PAS domain protein) [Desulforapulum autotrophicum HRM2]|uniref:Sigma-54 dependent transcriptional regulator (PAS domain protein) n=2 Tax=Desulforapulum autotrophicum TaxID=2296 RepID=C0QEM3_DESAH|nr:sigma-54 dependent transcriptional regulator (PAS domain protein) [Desulforapulum autotrophicum HRM2]
MGHNLYDQWLKILDHFNIGVILVDNHRRIRQCNTSARNLLRLSEDEIIGGDCQEIFCGLPCFPTCPFHDPETSDVRDMDVEFLDEAGEKHRVTRVGAPLLDDQGRVQGCVTVLQDHSPFNELVNRIHYEEQSLKIILDSLNMGIFTVNRGGLITFFNRAAEKVSGFSRMNLLGKACGTLFAGEGKQVCQALKQVLADRIPATAVRGELLSFQGEVIPISGDYIPLLNDHGGVIGALAAFQDMTLVQQLNQAIKGQYHFHHMIGKDPAMQRIFDMVRVVAKTESTLLIEGATGTGKDLLAKIIHSESNRSKRPFVKVNCAAIPDNLVESEIFGYVRGAFTGADRDKPGRFSEAHSGTIFLDEIGDLPLALQAKLLRVLEDREFYPLGSRKTQRVDVRILSATNRKLESLVAQKLFREDLFYRLNVLRIDLPPLMNRRGDLPLLIRHLMRKQAGIMKKPFPDICETAMEILLNYHYPGNIRELENIIEHAIILCQEEVIRSCHLPAYILDCSGLEGKRDGFSDPSTVDPGFSGTAQERQQILDVLRANRWHRQTTANLLGMDRTTLWRKMRKFKISP